MKGSGSVRLSHQTVSDYTLRQWFPTLNSLAAGRHLEILVLYKSFILDDVKLAELSNNSFQWKNVTYSDPSYIFSGGGTFQSPGSTLGPCAEEKPPSRLWWHFAQWVMYLNVHQLGCLALRDDGQIFYFSIDYSVVVALTTTLLL